MAISVNPWLWLSHGAALPPVQPRFVNHGEIADFTNGTLTTVRVMNSQRAGKFELTNLCKDSYAVFYLDLFC